MIWIRIEPRNEAAVGLTLADGPGTLSASDNAGGVYEWNLTQTRWELDGPVSQVEFQNLASRVNQTQEPLN